MDKVKDIISNLLSIEKDNIKDNSDFFFDLNGSSLEYFSLISNINEEFMISIPFENDSMHTPYDITKVIEETLRK